MRLAPPCRTSAYKSSSNEAGPGVIEPAIASIEDANFLTPGQKRDILYNDDARFLRLSPEEIARHKAM